MDDPELRVLAEGEGWVCLAKPPWVISHRGPGDREERALLQMARDLLGCRVHLVHRLDRQTSGCVLIATDPDTTTRLHAALKEPTATKTYVTLVRGRFASDEAVRVETPMKDGKGVEREAASTVSCLGRSRSPRCSLLRVQPETGRFHQVRRHVRDLHHPILGDAEHGDTRENRRWREQHGLKRLALHCLRVELDLEGQRLGITSPLFMDQAELFARLPFWEQARSAEPALSLPPLPYPGWLAPR